MTISNEFRVGIMFLTGLILLILVIVTLTQWGQTRRTNVYTIRFKAAQGLEKGAAVHVAGVEAGRVEEIRLDPDTTEALVTVRVNSDVNLREDYTYAIGMGGIVGERFVDIVPKPGKDTTPVVKPGSEIAGTERADLNALMNDASRLVAQLNVTAKSLNDIVGSDENQENLRASLANLNKTLNHTEAFTRELDLTLARNQAALGRTVSNFEATSHSAAQFTAAVNGLMARNEREVDAIIGNLRQTSMSSSEFIAALNLILERNQQVVDLIVANLGKTSSSAAEFTAGLNATLQRNQQSVDLIVANLEDITTDLRGLSDSLSGQGGGTHIVRNLEQASSRVVEITDRLASIATAVDALISDKSLREDVQTSVSNLRKASDDLTALMGDVREAAEPFPQVTANLRDASEDLRHITAPVRDVAPETATNILEISRSLRRTSEGIGAATQQIAGLGRVLRNTRIQPEARLLFMDSSDQQTRADLNLDIISPKNMVRIGVADVGYDDRLNLQAGLPIGVKGKNGWFRYGLVQSSFGIGADLQINPDMKLSGEVFAPGDIRANATVSLRPRLFSDAWWLNIGAFDLFHKDTTAFGVGLVYRP